MPIIGIDLGTTNSLACVFQNGEAALIPGSTGEYLTPSCVGFDDDRTTLLVGRTAKDRLISHPEFTAADFKRLMGTDRTKSLCGKPFVAPELSSFVIRRLKENAEAFLGEPVEEAVISVPAYFDDNGRNAVKEAGELAGLKVDRIINEPSAAALAYRVNDDDDTCFLVFDLGGGTLDVTVVEAFDNIIEVISAAGDNRLGGRDFDMAIADWFCRNTGLEYEALPPTDRAVLLNQAELGKIALNEKEEVMISCRLLGEERSAVLSSDALVRICARLFKKMESVIRRALQDADKTINEIDRVVLVGGSSRMSLVRSYIRQLTGAEICDSIDPDIVVGIGVGLAAGIKMRCPGLRDTILTDVCPFSLGVDVLNRADTADSLFSPIIPRNSTLPASRQQRYYTVNDNQKLMVFNIYQGDHLYCRDNLLLGTVKINVPAAKAGEECCDTRFSYDINGILEVDVRCVSTGQTVETVIMNSHVRLSESELEEKKASLGKLKILPRDEEENKAVIARAEQLYTRCNEEGRDMVGRMTSLFGEALGSQDPRKIREAKKTVTELFDEIEASLNSFDVLSRPDDDLPSDSDEPKDNLIPFNHLK